MRSIVKKFGVASPNDRLIVQQMISLCIFIAVYSTCAYFSYRYIKAIEQAREVPSGSPGYDTAAIDVQEKFYQLLICLIFAIIYQGFYNLFLLYLLVRFTR